MLIQQPNAQRAVLNPPVSVVQLHQAHGLTWQGLAKVHQAARLKSLTVGGSFYDPRLYPDPTLH